MNWKYSRTQKWIGRVTFSGPRPITHVGIDVRLQAARRRRAFDLTVERFAVERFAVERFVVIVRRALPERFAAVFAFALRAGLAFFFAVLAMLYLSLICPVDSLPKKRIVPT